MTTSLKKGTSPHASPDLLFQRNYKSGYEGVTKDTGEILSIATPIKFEEIPEPTFVGIPIRLGQSIGTSIYADLLQKEKEGIAEAAKVIYQTYKITAESLE